MLSHLRSHDRRLFAQLDMITAGLVEAATLLHRLLSGTARDAAATAAAARTLDVRASEDSNIDVRTFSAYAQRLDNAEFRALGASLDAAFESVQDGTAHAYSLRATDAPPELRALAALLVDAAALLHVRVPNAGRRADPDHPSGGAAELLERGDALYYAGVGALFDGRSGASEVLRWKDIYDAVHQALARCMSAADVLSRFMR